MRVIATLILVLVCTLGHASAVICPDGVTYTDSAANKCPAYRTSIGIGSITQTTAQVTGTVDAQGAGSTHYVWVAATQFPPGCSSLNFAYADLSSATPATRQAAEKARQKCMNYKTMQAGTGSVAFGSTAVPSAGAYAQGISGLTAGATYYVQDFFVGGLGGAKVSLMATQALTMNASGGGGGEALVADSAVAPRYIGTGGNDSNDGLTPATRWLNPDKTYSVCSFPAGTNIALLNTSTFSGPKSKMSLCYDSTSTDWAIVGSYKLNGSSVPIWTVDGIRGNTETDQKAKFLGPITSTCITNRNCDYRTSAYVADGLSSIYEPRISITGNYIDFRNVEFEKSIGYDLVVSGTGNSFYGYTGLGSTHHIILDGLDSWQAAGAANVFVDGVSDLIYRNSTVDTWGLCAQLRQLGNPTYLTDDTCPPIAVPSAGGFVRSQSARGLIENNDFYKGYGEGGVDCGNGASFIIYRGNRHYGSTSVSQYMDGCSDTVVENGIMIGGNDYGLVGAGNTGPGDFGGISSGIGVGVEDWQGLNGHSANNNLIRNNLIIRPSGCFPWGLGATPDLGTSKMGVRLHGNTCIAANGPDLSLWYETTSEDIQVMDIKSNLWWNETYNTFSLNYTTSNTNNHSYTARFSAGGSNASTGDPQLVTAYGTWSTYKGPSSWPTFALARPSPGSPLNDAGVSSEATVVDYTKFGWAATQMADVLSGAITLVNWSKERYYCSGSLNEVCGPTPPKGAVCAAAGC